MKKEKYSDVDSEIWCGEGWNAAGLIATTVSRRCGSLWYSYVPGRKLKDLPGMIGPSDIE